mmetsp:Transcript_46939/g.68615  ORF Transcript_46939/g.68615 Transcript_46939/m.68615 type:complete len:188 (-) Transcript_46939:394-957(-)
MGIRKSYSQLFFASSEADPDSNRNTEWLRRPMVGMSYLAFLFIHCLLWYGLGFCSFSTALTLTNVVNCAAQLYFVHWVKGAPEDHATQGEFNGWTLWEQLDPGVDWTPTKKFLALVPLVLCLAACGAADYSVESLLINVPGCLIVTVAKLPQMDHVRVLGINSTVGIDDAGYSSGQSTPKIQQKKND